VPVEVLRCIPRRYLAREGFDGGRWGEVILFFLFPWAGKIPDCPRHALKRINRGQNPTRF
jgi:hypothetical protein